MAAMPESGIQISAPAEPVNAKPHTLLLQDLVTTMTFYSRLVLECDQVLNKLREAEILLSQGDTIAIVSKKIGVSEYTYYRWRKEYGGLRVEQAHRLKELEQENSRLRRSW